MLEVWPNHGKLLYKVKVQCGYSSRLPQPSCWFLLDVLSIQLDDVISVHCYLLIHFEVLPKGTLCSAEDSLDGRLQKGRNLSCSATTPHKNNA